MGDVRRADAAARWQAALIAGAGAILGALLILAFQRYSPRLREWIVAEPAQLSSRARLVLLLTATALAAPLMVFALYMWRIGTMVMALQQFPLPGQRVIRDTPVVVGEAASSRGRARRGFACAAAAGAVLLLMAFWHLAEAFTRGTPG